MSYTATKKEIKNLGLSNHTLYFKITFKDYGIAFLKDMETKIFELYQRLHGKNEYKDKGIGLSIVKRTRDIHEGTIVANSIEGKMTTFTQFYLKNNRLTFRKLSLYSVLATV